MSVAEKEKVETFKNFVNGEWKTSRNGATFENENPALRGSNIALFQSSTPDDVREAIDVRPERTLRTCPAHRVVDALLVRAADDAIVRDRVTDAMLSEKRRQLVRNCWVVSNVAGGDDPFTHLGRLGAVARNHRRHQLRGQTCIGTVDGDRRQRKFRWGR